MDFDVARHHFKLLFFFGAENETRTRDPDLGKVVLYQLSYFRLRIARQKYNFFQYRKQLMENFSFCFYNTLIINH